MQEDSQPRAPINTQILKQMKTSVSPNNEMPTENNNLAPILIVDDTAFNIEIMQLMIEVNFP